MCWMTMRATVNWRRWLHLATLRFGVPSTAPASA